jgi:pilus assembly protein Flp/PilA
MNSLKRFFFDTEAATAVEYAVMMALILAVIIAGIASVGGGNAALWQNSSDQMETYFP